MLFLQNWKENIKYGWFLEKANTKFFLSTTLDLLSHNLTALSENEVGSPSKQHNSWCVYERKTVMIADIIASYPPGYMIGRSSEYEICKLDIEKQKVGLFRV